MVRDGAHARLLTMKVDTPLIQKLILGAPPLPWAVPAAGRACR
jgi:hypothetical protein